jgi:glucosamine--fructose-6-phosphate aminotransferase (isomerizing)
MCGIVGYIGPKEVVPVLIGGLRKLEYRGYDSAGLAVVKDQQVSLRRASGKLANLVRSLEAEPLIGDYGIGHTRWATHGRPTEENAHPHRDCTGKVVVVHNGIIENYLELKTRLLKSNHKFITETDTEVIAHLVESLLPGRTFIEAVREAINQLRGSFAICMLSADNPNTLIAARSGPPLIVGMGNEEFFVASDVPALLEHTRSMYFMQDGEMAILTTKGVVLQDFQGQELSFAPHEVSWSPEMAEKGGFRHFMLKEIHEHPAGHNYMQIIYGFMRSVPG